MRTQTAEATAGPGRVRQPGRVLMDWLTTTDHKKIGHLCLITSFGFFLIAGLMALRGRPHYLCDFFGGFNTRQDWPYTGRTSSMSHQSRRA